MFNIGDIKYSKTVSNGAILRIEDKSETAGLFVSR